MTEKEILKKAIKKAINNGFTFFGNTLKKDFKIFDIYYNDDYLANNYSYDYKKEDVGDWIIELDYTDHDGNKNCTKEISLTTILYRNPDFAKAFWGDEIGDLTHVITHKNTESFYPNGANISQPKWQYHLQIMVLEDNPIKYLEKFL